jgi:hypothetical protein
MDNKRGNSPGKSLNKSQKKLNSKGKRSPSPAQKDIIRKSNDV